MAVLPQHNRVNMKKIVLTVLLGATSIVQASEPAQRQLLWGDTHLHTSTSADVFIFDNRNATADIAYRFAKGQPVESPVTGTIMQLNRPLDFLVVADHAEMLGSVQLVFEGENPLSNSVSGREIKKTADDSGSLLSAYGVVVNALMLGKDESTGLTGKQVMQDLHSGDKRSPAWQRNTAAADRHNQPGEFTALIGWEWSSMQKGANLHRVVVTDSDAQVANQYLPFSQFESSDPEDLWRWLDKTATSTGAEFLAIPHNPNISKGQMFSSVRFDGKTPLDAAYAKERMRWEPLLEMTQIKGDSETHPVLSPNDVFADFESFNFILMPSGEREPATEADYARSALKNGLAHAQRIGVNPFKFGMIGSTDSHTGISAVEEDNFAGKAKKDALPRQRSEPTGIGSSTGWDMSSGGFMGVWADENTRHGLLDAMRRKEVYATSGPRISLRFFAGWQLNSDDTVVSAYQKGVPMGGDLLMAPKNVAPSFIVFAEADPFSASLDRIQIVKGWLDDQGNTHEKVYNVIGAQNRLPDDNGEMTAIDNTVDLKTANYDRSSGANALSAYWTDPDFDPQQAAFYYTRVLEIPSPRYSLRDAVALGVDVSQTKHVATIQERAYSSPIWYTPN